MDADAKFSYRLHGSCCVFQSEILDILIAMDMNRLHASEGSDVTIYDDSKAVQTGEEMLGCT